MADHANDFFIDFGNYPTLYLHLLHLLKQGLDKHSQVELDLSGLLARVSVNILDLDDLRDVLYDLHDPVNLVHLDNVDQLLTEKLGQPTIHLVV